MELQDVLRSLWRRWYFVVIGLIAAAATGYGLLTTIPPTYQQVSTSVMIPGKGAVEDGDNPLLYIGGLTQQRDLVVRAAQADIVKAPILEAHPGADFTITADFTTPGPVIVVTATGPTPEATTATMELANEAVAHELQLLQSEAGTPDRARTTLLDVATDSEPEAQRKDQLQFTVLGAGGVLALSLLLTVLIDGRSQARARRRRLTGRQSAGLDAVVIGSVLEPAHPAKPATPPPTEAITAVPLGPSPAYPGWRALRSVNQPAAHGAGSAAAAVDASERLEFQRRHGGSV